MINVFADPPGALYAMAYVIAATVFSFYIRKSTLRKPERIMGIGLVAAIVTFMVVTDNVPQPLFLPCIAVALVMLYGMVYFFNELNWKKTLYYTAHMYILGEFSASLDWQLYYYIIRNQGKIWISPGDWVVMVPMLFLEITFVMWLGKRWYDEKADVDISEKQAVTVVLIALCVFGLSNLSYVPVKTPFSGAVPEQIFNIHTLVDLGGIAILFAYHTLLIDMQRRIDFDNMKNILDMQYINYQVSKQSVDIINQKYHDLKHQINILRREFGSEKGMQYLDEMQSEIEAYEAQNKTGNKVLDTILTGKSLYCQQNGIRLTCVADGSLLGFMDMLDISSLFGNALDNAIESVAAIENPEERLIHFTISRNKGFLRIKVENRYRGNVNFEDGLPQTTKNDRNYHGYGIKSIQTIVKKYGGSVTIIADGGWFELRILIPISGVSDKESI
ncbi:MAG: sensor histidine kinase [Blautia sp.]|nr:sensor histidine kinase [Blautia sp.]